MFDDPPSEFSIALETTAAPEPERTEAELIEDVLLESGIAAPPESIRQLDALCDRLAYRRAGEALRHLASAIPEGTAAGIALRRVLLGLDEPIRAAASKAGCSHVAVLRAEKRIRRWVGVTKAPPCRR